MSSYGSSVLELGKRIGSAYTNGCRKTIVALSTGVVMADVHASAGITLGDVGNNAGDNAAGLTNGAMLLSGFVGLVMVVIAFVKGRTAKQQGEGIGTYVGMAFIGALLLSIPTVISIFNNTVLGDDASSAMQSKIIS